MQTSWTQNRKQKKTDSAYSAKYITLTEPTPTYIEVDS
jgi:hypothetical protein